MRELRRMEHFAADAIKAERDAHIRAAIKANVPWSDLSEQYGLTHAEIEKMILDSTVGATRRGSALIVAPRDPKGGKDENPW